jgi:hypothetical protein
MAFYDEWGFGVWLNVEWVTLHEWPCNLQQRDSDNV